jgi:hypothetical protein
VGKYGGGMRLCITSSKLTSLKNGCRLISSASALPDPRRRAGSRVSNYGDQDQHFPGRKDNSDMRAF